MKHDRNFDDLVEKFERRIYGTLKGELRLALLKEDLGPLHDGPPLDVWDAGCGLGQMACWFAEGGHRVIACDISGRMLERARQRARAAGVAIDFRQCAAQEMARSLLSHDLVLFHAVIEWLAQPLETLAQVADTVRPGGWLSLLFFNHHALIYRNLLQGGWRIPWVLEGRWEGRGRKLTPPHPQKPEALTAWLTERGFEIVRHTGIRVFYDYLPEAALDQTDLDQLLAAERRFCREPTFRNMGRYIHLLARKRP